MADEPSNRVPRVAVPREVVEFFVRWHSPGAMPASPNMADMLPRLKAALDKDPYDG